MQSQGPLKTESLSHLWSEGDAAMETRSEKYNIAGFEAEQGVKSQRMSRASSS